jgi:hypothetical protein
MNLWKIKKFTELENRKASREWILLFSLLSLCSFLQVSPATPPKANKNKIKVKREPKLHRQNSLQYDGRL